MKKNESANITYIKNVFRAYKANNLNAEEVEKYIEDEVKQLERNASVYLVIGLVVGFTATMIVAILIIAK